MNCPHCGAKELMFAPYETYYGDKPRFECNTTFRGIAGDYCLANQLEAAKRELAELRSKLTPEGAEPLKIKDLVWKKVFEGMYLARPILGGHAFVEQHDRIFWKYDLNGNTVTRFHTAKQAQDACNAEHKRLIAEWV